MIPWRGPCGRDSRSAAPMRAESGPRVRRPHLSCIVLLLSSGCLLGELERIPCGGDDECPTGYFCDLPRQQCFEQNDRQAPPLLVLAGARVDGRVTDQLHLPVDEETRFTLVVENRAPGIAYDPQLEFSPLSCVKERFGPLPAQIPGNAAIDVTLDVSAGIGCGVPITVDWFMFYSGRGSRGTILLVPES
jgi:hypothetical protein